MCKYTSYIYIYTFYDIYIYTSVYIYNNFLSVLTHRHMTQTCSYTPVRNIWKYAVGKCDNDSNDNIFIDEAIMKRFNI